jgi:hypothetical protein
MCLIKHHATKTYGKLEVHLHTFLATTLDLTSVVNATGRFIFGEGTPVYIREVAVWALEPMAKRKISNRAGYRIPILQSLSR